MNTDTAERARRILTYTEKENKSQKGVQVASRMTPLFRGGLADQGSLGDSLAIGDSPKGVTKGPGLS